MKVPVVFRLNGELKLDMIRQWNGGEQFHNQIGMNVVQLIEARCGFGIEAEASHRKGILQIARYTLGLFFSIVSKISFRMNIVVLTPCQRQLMPLQYFGSALLPCAISHPVRELFPLSFDVPEAFSLFQPSEWIDRSNSFIFELSLAFRPSLVLLNLFRPDAPLNGPKWWRCKYDTDAEERNRNYCLDDDV